MVELLRDLTRSAVGSRQSSCSFALRPVVRVKQPLAHKAATDACLWVARIGQSVADTFPWRTNARVR